MLSQIEFWSGRLIALNCVTLHKKNPRRVTKKIMVWIMAMQATPSSITAKFYTTVKAGKSPTTSVAYKPKEGQHYAPRVRVITSTNFTSSACNEHCME